jgi:dihydroorotase
MRILIRGGHAVDPGRLDGICDILIEDGKIKDIRSEKIPEAGMDRVIDATGLMVVPGLIDMHVHFREPGQEHKETILTGCRAAAHGGFTAVCTMPNTDPVNDNRKITEYIRLKAEEAASARVYPVGAISLGLRGESLSDFEELKSAGAIALTDDGMPVRNSRLMRQAMERAKELDLLIISHAEDLDLAAGGAMNEGETASRLGYAGIPNASESIAVMRDIALCELTGARLHIAHVSTAESVRAIRAAKNRGARVTAETAPHYFTLTDSAVELYGTHAKMNPPLRSSGDREAIREGLSDGAIDVIATDHAPHAPKEKELPFEQAPNGIIGLETAFPVSFSLVEDGILTIEQLVEKMATNPARILGLDHGIKIGNTADITIFDPEQSTSIKFESFFSKSRNCPFNGWKLKGQAKAILVQGYVIFAFPKSA